jgi:hypothetical protein
MAKTTQINIALPPALLEELDRAANKHGFSRSELARLILAERLAGTLQLIVDRDAANKLAAMRPRGRPKGT